MQLLNIALVVLCCWAGVAHSQAVTAACPAGTCTGDLVCQEGTCMVKIGQSCTADSTDECVATAAPCPSAGNTLQCGCPTGATANGDNTECTCDDANKVIKGDKTTCVLKAGETGCTTGDCLDDATCNTGTCECDANFVASTDNTKCLVKIGQSCTADSTDECVATAAPCPSAGTLQCGCPTGATANGDNTECTCDDANKVIKGDKTTCVLKAGETGCNNAEDCLDNADCNSGTCECQENFKANDDKTKCSGGSAVMASLTLLLAALVASLWM